jgi:hypothetical protein
MSERELPWEGGCRCGQVRIRVSAPPLLTMACHCTGCQRMSASAYSLSVAVPTEGFSILQGEPIVGGLRGATRHFFCPQCMSWMFTRPEGLDFFVNVRATMLDDPSWYMPFIETYTSEKLPWATTPARHKYEQFPPREQYTSLLQEYAAYFQTSGTYSGPTTPPGR